MMKIRYLVIVSLAVFVYGFVQLGLNQQHAQQMAVNILIDDKRGSDQVPAEVQQLKQYSSTHMNAGVSFELRDSYIRDLDKSQAANGAIYAQAQAACANLKDSLLQARCVTSYVAPLTKNNTPPPNENDYKYTFYSPRWTPDAAGIALVVGATGLLLSGWFALF